MGRAWSGDGVLGKEKAAWCGKLEGEGGAARIGSGWAYGGAMASHGSGPKWQRVLAASGRLARGHMQWLRKGLRGGQALMVVGYLAFLMLSVGVAVGYFIAPRDQWVMVNGVRHKTPPPVTPPPPGTKWVEVQTTGYCPCGICCGKDADGRTAINRPVTRYPYGVAVEPKLIPYRTWLSIPGYGEAMVDDTGGAMRQSAKRDIVHLDLRFKTHKTARKWGRQWQWIAMPAETPAAQRYGIGRDQVVMDP